MKVLLREMIAATLREVALDRVMAESLFVDEREFKVGSSALDLATYERIFVAAIGKAARPMAGYLGQRLPEEKTYGVVVTSVAEGEAPACFETLVGGHPYPNEQSFEAAMYALRRAAELGSKDLFICLLSGGGSAICEAPIDDAISLDDVRSFYEVLVTCGANIVDMNVLRKHLSRVKGGRLAQAAHPATQLTLYVSDVPPGEPSTVASGPTMPDESTVETAYETAERLGIVAPASSFNSVAVGGEAFARDSEAGRRSVWP